MLNVEYLLKSFSRVSDESSEEDAWDEEDGETEEMHLRDKKAISEFSLVDQNHPFDLIDGCYILDFNGKDFFLKNFSIFSYNNKNSDSILKLENEMGSRMNLKKRNLGIDLSSASSSQNGTTVKVVRIFQSKSLVLLVVEKSGDMSDFYKNNMRVATVSLISYEKIKVISFIL